MHASLKFVPLVLGALVAALPSSNLDKRAGTSYDDNYDDLSSVVVAPQLAPVGTYHGLVYKGAVVVPPQVPGFADLSPHSKPNAAGAAHPLDLLQLGSLSLNAFIQLTRATGVNSFDLESFYWGLATDDGTSVGIPQGGSIAVVGFTVGGQEVTSSYSFSPHELVNQPLTFAQLPSSFKNLQNATIGIAVAEPITERTYLQVDNLKHTNY